MDNDDFHMFDDHLEHLKRIADAAEKMVTPVVLTETIPTHIDRLETTGQAWAAAAEYADRLEETRRIKLAELKLDCKEHSDVAKETWALAQASYRDHVDEMVRARYAERKARVAYLVAQLNAGVSVKGE